MALKRKPRSRAKAQAPVDMTRVRVVTRWTDINDITPYEYNARDNSKAVAAVANSIKTFGFIMPVVLGADGVLAAGHTRVEAAKSLGMTHVLAIDADHLTTEQIDAFRLVDNKVAEIADWDDQLLGQEIARLQASMGDTIDFTDYGWEQQEIDCLSQLVSEDCLSVEDIVPEAQRPDGQATERRAPSTVRMVFGEFVFFVESVKYRAWIDGLRRLHNFNEADMVEDLKDRIGLLD